MAGGGNASQVPRGHQRGAGHDVDRLSPEFPRMPITSLNVLTTAPRLELMLRLRAYCPNAENDRPEPPPAHPGGEGTSDTEIFRKHI